MRYIGDPNVFLMSWKWNVAELLVSNADSYGIAAKFCYQKFVTNVKTGHSKPIK